MFICSNFPTCSCVCVQTRAGADYLQDSVVIYNRVPKTGSTSFVGLAYDLYHQNLFHIAHVNVTKNSHILSVVDQVCKPIALCSMEGIGGYCFIIVIVLCSRISWLLWADVIQEQRGLSR